ncbi:Hypothetical_protein [Hexamita inflata]|uniref:Hypothetical_protein n=1 Tax=Hexamita inflata TaxID=28002 RepID=A0AA86NCC5_9EUKA|nr:Hypothetical protein HINF_LOCUS4797 [Hexamita inflata]
MHSAQYYENIKQHKSITFFFIVLIFYQYYNLDTQTQNNLTLYNTIYICCILYFIYYKAEYIETFTILCDLEKRLESHDAVISNVNVNFDDITDRLRTLGTEIALFAVERIEARLTGADNLLTKAIKLKDFLQPKFKPSDYNLELLSNYVLGVNELFSGVVDQILLEDVMMHFNSSEIENKRYGSALNLWCQFMVFKTTRQTFCQNYN